MLVTATDAEDGLARFPLLGERLAEATRVTPIRGQGPIAVRARRVAGWSAPGRIVPERGSATGPLGDRPPMLRCR